ncbi:DUF5590 domain-containing protein [Evansella sp. AB-rgal1]|uniref:cell wall elongation regulator TseB-like domain-containing protein n=1 Tax=Evansella sp. AB-rgal1 TaxID=3242696 RepID=UPI00359DA141
MKRWIFPFIVIILTAFIGLFYYLYMEIKEPLQSKQAHITQVALSETDLDSVKQVDFYHGRRSFQVIEGKDSNGEDMFVWIEELINENEGNTEPQIITRYKSEGITIGEVRSIVQSRLSITQLKSIKLGIIGNTPIYEVIYIDDANRHSFYYLTFEDGEYIRHYQFQRS